jgi:membrane protein CcdC involved in cytochrome C biogenesis
VNGAVLILPAILLLLALKIWRTGGRERPLRMSRLWVLPLLFTVLVGSGLVSQPVPLTVITIDAWVAAFIVGFGCGWFRGRTTHITVDAEGGGLKARTTPIGLVLIAGLVLIRLMARDYLSSHAEEWNISPIAIVDGFMVFALGLIYGWRIEMLLRCRRLLQQTNTDPVTRTT